MFTLEAASECHALAAAPMPSPNVNRRPAPAGSDSATDVTSKRQNG
ncbi:MAG: hypothetical protein ACR2G4_03645 [Pyrinomonadaceae bacterium]